MPQLIKPDKRFISKTILSFAYGSNLNCTQMALRCPGAEPLGRLRLKDWQLVFRGVADIIPEPGATCWGGVWRIRPSHEAALDRYEGVSSGLYRKEYIPIKKTDHGETELLIYTMNSTGVFPPSEHYLQTIVEGYHDFHLPKTAFDGLDRALWEAWADKAPTEVERARHQRGGKPHLAVPYYGDDAWEDAVPLKDHKPKGVSM